MHSKLSSILPLFLGITAGVATSQDAPRTAIPAASVPSTPPPTEALPTETTPPKALPYVFFGDYDGDELADAFIVQPDGSGRLVHNEGDGLFIDVTERAGLTGAHGMHMAAWGDANGDGKLDLYLPAWRGASRLFVQLDDSTFVERTEAAGLPLYAEPLDAKWLDFDNDGHLDLQLTTLYDDLDGYGVWGINFKPGGAGLVASGDILATGTKFFVRPHPAYADKVVRFVCLEGNEAGTYFRGSSATFGKVVEIEVPDVFRMGSDPDNITVQVTPRGPAMVWVESVDLERVVVRSSADVEFDYFVNGVRHGYQNVDLIADNRLYVPQEIGLPYGAHLPDEVRQMLVDNGTLNADFTPNEATAEFFGWELDEAGTAAAKRAELDAGSQHQRIDKSMALGQTKDSVPRTSSQC